MRAVGRVRPGRVRGRHGRRARRLVRRHRAVPASDGHSRSRTPRSSKEEGPARRELELVRRAELPGARGGARRKSNRRRFPLRVGTWMAEPAHAERVATETSTVLRGVVGVLRDEDIQQIIDNTIVKRIAEPEWGPPIGARALRTRRREPAAAPGRDAGRTRTPVGTGQSGDHRPGHQPGFPVVVAEVRRPAARREDLP